MGDTVDVLEKELEQLCKTMDELDERIRKDPDEGSRWKFSLLSVIPFILLLTFEPSLQR